MVRGSKQSKRPRSLGQGVLRMGGRPERPVLKAKGNDNPRHGSCVDSWGHLYNMSVRSDWGENGKSQNGSSMSILTTVVGKE